MTIDAKGALVLLEWIDRIERYQAMDNAELVEMMTTVITTDNEWVAMQLVPEGWVVLSPWITTTEGYRYRHTIQQFGYREGARRLAEHLAAELNLAARARWCGEPEP